MYTEGSPNEPRVAVGLVTLARLIEVFAREAIPEGGSISTLRAAWEALRAKAWVRTTPYGRYIRRAVLASLYRVPMGEADPRGYQEDVRQTCFPELSPEACEAEACVWWEREIAEPGSVTTLSDMMILEDQEAADGQGKGAGEA